MEPIEGWTPSLEACEESLHHVITTAERVLHPDLMAHLEGVHIYLKAAVAQMGMVVEVDDETEVTR